MSNSDDKSLEELRQETTKGDRLDEAPAQQRQADLQASMREHLAALDAGDRQKTVSVWDGNLAAFIAALEDHPEEMQAVGEALAAELDSEIGDDVERSEVLRMALRLGFREAAPEHIETLREAVREQAVNSL